MYSSIQRAMPARASSTLRYSAVQTSSSFKLRWNLSNRCLRMMNAVRRRVGSGGGSDAWGRVVRSLGRGFLQEAARPGDADHRTMGHGSRSKDSETLNRLGNIASAHQMAHHPEAATVFISTPDLIPRSLKEEEVWTARPRRLERTRSACWHRSLDPFAVHAKTCLPL